MCQTEPIRRGDSEYLRGGKGVLKKRRFQRPTRPASWSHHSDWRTSDDGLRNARYGMQEVLFASRRLLEAKEVCSCLASWLELDTRLRSSVSRHYSPSASGSSHPGPSKRRNFELLASSPGPTAAQIWSGLHNPKQCRGRAVACGSTSSQVSPDLGLDNLMIYNP
jgi:hypothetical protein